MKEYYHVGDRINFEEEVENCFSMSFLPLDFFDSWERGSLLANFLADYYRHNFPEDSAHNLISTVLNELIENAVKFSRNNSLPVKLVLKKRGHQLLMQAVNAIPSRRSEPFKKVCARLFEGDLDSLYVDSVTENMHNSTSSGIGLILIRKDYASGLSFDFSSDDNNSASVAVTVELDFA